MYFDIYHYQINVFMPRLAFMLLSNVTTSYGIFCICFAFWRIKHPIHYNLLSRLSSTTIVFVASSNIEDRDNLVKTLIQQILCMIRATFSGLVSSAILAYP